MSSYQEYEDKESKNIGQYLFKMREMGLLNPEGSSRQIKTMKFGGEIRDPTVMNDFHTKETNRGFSRKPSGGFYEK